MKVKFCRILLPVVLLLAGCTYKEIPAPTPVVVDCSKSTLAISESNKVDASSCFSIDGHFTVLATGGTSPYLFSFNGAGYVLDPNLSGLGPGTYLVTVKDANLCQKSDSVKISVAGSTLDATAAVGDDTECLTNNGTITVTPSGGTSPYTYQWGDSPDITNSRSNLKFGYYTVTVRDSQSPACIRMMNVWVHRGNTGISFATDIKPILDTKCATTGCHNGDNGSTRNWTIFDNVKSNAKHIKLRTGNKTMPLGDTLTQDQINLIACWVDDGGTKP